MLGVDSSDVVVRPGPLGLIVPRAVLLRAEGDDRDLEMGIPQIEQVDVDTELLWVTTTFDDETMAMVASTVGEPALRLSRLMRSADRPTFRDDAELTVFSVRVPDPDENERSNAITCAIGRGWVATAEAHPSDILSRFGEYVNASDWLGSLDSASFAALLMEWLFSQYMRSFEMVEREVDRIDTKLLAGEISNSDDAVAVLVALRRRVSLLRRMLAEHRDLEVWLAHAVEHPLVSVAAMQHLERISPRLEQARQAADTARDSINGSFALLMSTAAQRTNDIIKLLTVVSVTLLPATLVTGVMGMNFHPSFFDQPALFWVVVAVMTSFVSGALIAARRGRWI